MIYAILRFITMCLPYWVVMQIYKRKKSLPANIKTKTGKVLKATMITDKYGIIFTEKEYLTNRVKYLREQQEKINAWNESIAKEMNSLSMEAREMFFNEGKDENRDNR